MDGYFTKRREDLLTTQDGTTNFNGGRKTRKDSYHLKLTPAMIRLLPEHARKKFFDTDTMPRCKTITIVTKESQISKNTETLEGNARSSPTPPAPVVRSNGIQAKLQERLRAISEKNKSIQIKSDARDKQNFEKEEDFAEFGGPSNTNLSFAQNVTNDFHEKKEKSDDPKHGAKDTKK